MLLLKHKHFPFTFRQQFYWFYSMPLFHLVWLFFIFHNKR